ncbi:NADP-dependent oxidoreductase domain-containing protein [Ephemerocybe angulata]|uniref:NADP-dependent oxidoreductase domain-containing protein n=1 Tax=Ephemerocybe angulata TaxID=980116 RepID=A0A8H6LW86_9AGAR|nr:NADP-dependent oxidoreductase domain-containing protein [Tulosesus angulatus]
MSVFAPPPPPKSKLGHYRKFSTMAGVHVSPIILGGMSIGDKWEEHGMGSMNKEDSFKLLDAYFDLGGNHIDTANLYLLANERRREVSEINFSLLPSPDISKYSGNPKNLDDSVAQKVFYGGNSAKSMHISLEASLKNLRTTYIDLFYVHWWDYDTSIPEVMQTLHSFVTSHKVLYLGISDAPAWVVSAANQYARDHGLTPFCVYQGLWNVVERSFERDIIPMARYEGMALAPWSVLAEGKIRTDAEEESRIKANEVGRTAFSSDWLRNDTEKNVCKVLEKIAQDIGAKSIRAVAIAYVMHKTQFVFPIIGGRKVEHLVSNLEALDISLTDEHLKAIESAVPFNPGFPHYMIGDGVKQSHLHATSGHLERWPIAKPITPTIQK